jgi:hypothetical protein
MLIFTLTGLSSYHEITDQKMFGVSHRRESESSDLTPPLQCKLRLQERGRKTLQVCHLGATIHKIDA